MGRRVKPTHLLTVTRHRETQTGYTDDPETTEETVVEDEPVRYWPRGILLRDSSGDMIQREPNITGNGHLSEKVQKGDTLKLEPLQSKRDPITGIEAVHVGELYGRQRRPIKTRIRVGDI